MSPERATFEQVLAFGQLLAQESARRVTAAARVQELEAALLDVEGSLLAYWTDIPEAECERLRLRIRAALASQATEETA